DRFGIFGGVTEGVHAVRGVRIDTKRDFAVLVGRAHGNLVTAHAGVERLGVGLIARVRIRDERADNDAFDPAAVLALQARERANGGHDERRAARLKADRAVNRCVNDRVVLADRRLALEARRARANQVRASRQVEPDVAFGAGLATGD